MSFFSRRRRPQSAARQSLHKRRRSQAGTRRLLLERLEDRVVLTAAGDLDLTFGTGGLVTTDFSFLESGQDDANAVAVASDGKTVVVGHSFHSGRSDLAVARYNADGSLDATFGVGGMATVDFSDVNMYWGSSANAVAVMADGRVVVAGQARRGFALARLTRGGELDSTFGIGGKQIITIAGSQFSVATDVAVMADGSVIVVGDTHVVHTNDSDVVTVARLTSVGQLDTTFGAGGKQTIDFASGPGSWEHSTSIAMQADGSAVIAGYGQLAGSSNTDLLVARLTNAGQLDTSFGTGGKQTIDFGSSDYSTDVALQADGSVVIAGYGQFVAGSYNTDFMVARLTIAGQLDTTFGSGGKQNIHFGSSSYAKGLVVQADGSVVMAGFSYQDPGGPFADFAVTRLTNAGQLDESFGIGGKQTIASGSEFAGHAVAVQPDGSVALAGNSYAAGRGYDFKVAWLTSAGLLETNFGGGIVTTDVLSLHVTDDNVAATNPVALAADGKLVVAGFSTQPARFGMAVARYNPDGSLDASFGIGGWVSLDFGNPYSGQVAVAVQANGSVVVVGHSETVGGSSVVARLTNSGQLDANFNGSGKQVIDFLATAVAVQADGSVVVAGGHDDLTVARLTNAGQLDETFGTSGMQTIDFGGYEFGTGLAVQSDGSMVVGGYAFVPTYYFDEYSGEVVLYTTNSTFVAARLTNAGQLDETFGTGGKQTIDVAGEEVALGLAVQNDGSVTMAGYSLTYTFDEFGTLHASSPVAAVARLTSTGQPDGAFSASGTQTADLDSTQFVRSVSVLADGSVAIVGRSYYLPETGYDIAVTRLTISGQLDSSFGADGTVITDFGSTGEGAQGVTVQLDGKIVVAGISNAHGTGNDFSLARYLGFTDTDDDGIEDGVDTLPLTFSDDFSDGTTSGTIANRGDQNITIVDAPNSADGVRITADFLGGAGPATIDVVGGASTLTLSAGDQVTVTHGSVIVDVLAGIVEATFVADAGGTATASLSSGNGLVFKPETFTFIAPITNTEVVQAMFPTESGQTVAVGLVSGNSVLFQPDTATFVAPATNTQPLEIVSDGTVVTVEPGESVSTGNSPPTAAVAGPTNGVRGQRRTLTLGATDAPADVAAGFTYRIDWNGDGLPDQTVTGPVGTAVDHVFTATGSYLVGVTATDNAGAESPIVTHPFTIGIAQVQVDPLDPSGYILAVGGGMGADKIHIELADDGDDDCQDDDADQLDAYKVKVQDRVEGRFKYRDSFAPPPAITRIVVFGQAGADDIQVAGDVDVTVEAHGGAGNDRIKGGRGDDLLFGDEGDDLLVGGQGRDLLIGGLGADRIVGNSDDDILVAGTTDFDASDAALRAIMSEWTSDGAYATRIANLAGTGSGESFADRLNENWLLSDATVHDDGAQDLLTGDGGRDWFFLNLILDANDDAAKKDKATDLGAQEFAVDLDFIGSL